MAGISFDRAADFYDATRALPGDAQERVADILAADIAGRGPALEIGVGTGRIALPLHRRGIDLVGVDLSVPMLARLVRNAGDRRPFGLVAGDATALPFRSARFGAVLCSHVLHLIPPWRAAVGEALRMLLPGGVLLVDFGGGPPAPWREPLERACRDVGLVRRRPGVSDPDELAAHLGAPAGLRPLAPVTVTVRLSLAADVADWEHRIHSWTWSASDAQLAAIAGAVRAWGAAEGVDPEEPVVLERVVRWWAWEPAGSR